jgi:hypothetical protein
MQSLIIFSAAEAPNYESTDDDHPRRHPPIYLPPDPVRGVGGVRARLMR